MWLEFVSRHSGTWMGDRLAIYRVCSSVELPPQTSVFFLLPGGFSLQTERETGGHLSSNSCYVGYPRICCFIWPGDRPPPLQFSTSENLLSDRATMSTPSSPPQDVPARRSFEELIHSSQTSSLAPQRPPFCGLEHGDGGFASPREVVGNILSSDLSGSPLSRAGYDTGRNHRLIFAP